LRCRSRGGTRPGSPPAHGGVRLPPPAGPPRRRSTGCSKSLYERLKECWEERFEHRYGFWRGLVDGVVARYLDCGILDHGLARIGCPECKKELLLAFSCKGRCLCPSCSAAWETVRNLMAEAVCEKQGFRPGMVAVVQTFGDQLNLHPQVHALVTRGG